MSRAVTLVTILWGAFALRAGFDQFAPDTRPLDPRKPLAELPMDVLGEGWEGVDVAMGSDIERAAGVSDYLQRSYRKGGATLAVYVGYVAGRVPDAVHHPAVCFPGGGLELRSQDDITLSAPGVDQPLRFREYAWRNPRGGGTYTLTSFYYRNKFEPEEWRLRADRVLGIRYFALITVSSSFSRSADTARDACQEALARLVPELLRHFP